VTTDADVHTGGTTPVSFARLDLSAYDTDKIANDYLRRYEPFVAPLTDTPVAVLELGVLRGGSLRLWRDYFRKGTIVGLDRARVAVDDPERRIHIYQGSQDDTALLTRIAREHAPAGFDLIIDDASHVAALTRRSFWHLFEHHLKPGGLYVIEDWGTGYWSDWPDGAAAAGASGWPVIFGPVVRRLRQKGGVRYPSHDFGMVGFVKELIDEQGAGDLTRRTLRGTPQRSSRFESVVVTTSIVFVRKAA
jgi:SAM-dependent methyltransferase